MSRSEIFLWPGEMALGFICSLLDIAPYSIDPGAHKICSIMLALVIWAYALRLIWELIKKAFGFGKRGR